MLALRMHNATQRFLSQSEGSDALACGLKWYDRWWLEHRDGSAETPQQMVGSLGHAVLAEVVRARHGQREDDPIRACVDEASRREWPSTWTMHAPQAEDAAIRIAAEMGLDHAHLLPNLYTDEGGPLAEVRLRANWAKVAWAFGGRDMPPSRAWLGLMRCDAIFDRFAGLEGQPDLVFLPDGPGGKVAIVDYKFRQRPDLGGATDEADGPALPDRQGAWYLTLLRALGMTAPAGFEFWQVNAYAGRWLTVDDFLDAARSAGETPVHDLLVTDKGLPTRDLDNRIGKVGMVTADVWAEAHRLLADRRLGLRLDNWRATGSRANKRPDMLSPAEIADANRFIADLKCWRPVQVVKKRADPLVCQEVVRDTVMAVEGPLRQAMAGVVPGRNLQTWRNSPCSKCSLRQPCHASLGTFSAGEALRSAAEARTMAEEAASAAC
jgi:hypothetical protein